MFQLGAFAGPFQFGGTPRFRQRPHVDLGRFRGDSLRQKIVPGVTRGDLDHVTHDAQLVDFFA